MRQSWGHSFDRQCEKCLHIYSMDYSETKISNVILELYWQLQVTKINDRFSGCFPGCKVRHIGSSNYAANLLTGENEPSAGYNKFSNVFVANNVSKGSATQTHKSIHLIYTMEVALNNLRVWVHVCLLSIRYGVTPHSYLLPFVF